MRPSQMGRLRAKNFRLDELIPYIAVPLVLEGVAATRCAVRPPLITYQIRHSFAAGLRRAETDMADVQDLYGHTRPETTMIYAPPELEKHHVALERLREHDGTGARPPVCGPVVAGAAGWQNKI